MQIKCFEVNDHKMEVRFYNAPDISFGCNAYCIKMWQTDDNFDRIVYYVRLMRSRLLNHAERCLLSLQEFYLGLIHDFDFDVIRNYSK